MTDEISGYLERITYRNEENGFTIARLKANGHPDPVTIAGNMICPTVGEILKIQGQWTKHPEYGRQFKIKSYKSAVPSTLSGIEKYLGSGLIKGIGPVMAKRIVEKFGEKTLDIIQHDIHQLANVPGIGKSRVATIKEAWDAQKEIRELMLFLQSHKISSGYAAKIFKQYGQRSIEVLKEDPFCLATDIFGIGFTTADNIAEKIGFPKHSEKRVQAGLFYILNQLANTHGHLYFPYEALIEKAQEILNVPRDIIVETLGLVYLNKKIVIEDLNQSFEQLTANNKAVYLTKYHFCETQTALLFKQLLSSIKSINTIDANKALSWIQERLSIRLSEGQTTAVKCAIQNKIMVITGGPGTGKTTIINAIIKIFNTSGAKILLAAPTGLAAKRMSKTCDHNARTIHRLLEFSFQKPGFQKNKENPLKCDLLIVDEASMIDAVLMHHLLKAIPYNATFLLVGDVNQLPSVGPGNMLKDIIASKTVPVVRLDRIFRQAQASQIIVNAHKINRGDIPLFKSSDRNTDFYMIEKQDPQEAADLIVKLVKHNIPDRFGFDSVDQIQVLTPMHKGMAGTENLNKELQKALNPQNQGIMIGQRKYMVSDKVMQIRNNYEKEVFNGDIGRITEINNMDQKVIIQFENREISYNFTELDEIILAYAITVHKSQGSEYPAIVIPLLTQHYIMLQRNLIYTAITRARKLVVVAGNKKALAIGVKNNKAQKRYTYLEKRLSDM